MDWNLALNKEGAPNWAKNYVDSPIIVMPENDEFYKQPMYYALYHFSKFVPPNSKRISLIDINKYPIFTSKSISAIAFLTPEENIVIVFLNKLVKNIFIVNIDGLVYTDRLILIPAREYFHTKLSLFQ